MVINPDILIDGVGAVGIPNIKFKLPASYLTITSASKSVIVIVFTTPPGLASANEPVAFIDDPLPPPPRALEAV